MPKLAPPPAPPPVPEYPFGGGGGSGSPWISFMVADERWKTWSIRSAWCFEISSRRAWSAWNAARSASYSFSARIPAGDDGSSCGVCVGAAFSGPRAS